MLGHTLLYKGDFIMTHGVREMLDKQNISLTDYISYIGHTYKRRCWIACIIFTIINTFMFYSRMQMGYTADLSDFILTPIKMSAYIWILTMILLNSKTSEHVIMKKLERLYVGNFRKFNILLEKINNLKNRKPSIFNEE